MPNNQTLNVYLPRYSPMALFHWRTVVPGVVALALIALELIGIALILARVLR